MSDAKTFFYKSHPSNRSIVLIRQDIVGLTIGERQIDETPVKRGQDLLDDVLALRDLGEIRWLEASYGGPHLVPERSR